MDPSESSANISTSLDSDRSSQRRPPNTHFRQRSTGQVRRYNNNNQPNATDTRRQYRVEYPPDYIPLTPQGYQNEMKKAILSCYSSQVTTAANLPPLLTPLEGLQEIWSTEPLIPFFIQEFTAEEESIINSGSFSSNHHHGQAKRTTTGQRGRGGSTRGTGLTRNSTSSNSLNDGASSSMSHKGEDEEGEGHNEEILWDSPVNETSMGVFDEKGNFKISGGGVSSPSFSAASHDAMAGEPGNDRLPPPSTLHSSSESKTNKAEGNKEVSWFYRDPSGQVQGPFANRKMLHWYSRNYFPESLPLRREEDILFEPLSAWKIKLGGISPFDWASSESENISPSLSNSTNISSLPNLSPIVGSSISIASPPIQQSHPAPESPAPASGTANILAKLGLNWNTPKSSEEEVVKAPATTATATESKSLANDQVEFLQKISKSATSASTAVPKSPSSSSEVKGISISLSQLGLTEDRPQPAVLTESVWKTIQSPVSPIDINAQLSSMPSKASTPKEIPPATPIVPRPISPAIISPKSATSPLELIPATPPTVGWAKPANNTRPLSEILQEEAEKESLRRASQPSVHSMQPKSFAETLKLASASSNVHNNANTVSSHGKAPRNLSPIIPPNPKSPITQSASSLSSPTTSNTKNDIKSWCLSQLKPLEGSLDINMCTILLLELKTPSEVTSFVEDNMRSAKMDLKNFTKELMERRFGSSSSPNTSQSEEEFVTAGRKGAVRKSK